MDFLPVPTNPVYTLPRVRHVARTPYDEGDFFTYPSRAGWPQALPEPNLIQFWLYEMARPSDNHDLERFLQNWIFFGLLHCVLGPHDLFVAAEYVGNDAQGEYLKTDTLVDRLEHWLQIAAAWSKETKQEEMKRVEACLRAAAVSMQVLALESHSDFPRASRVLFANVAEFIQEVSLKLLPEGEYSRHTSWLDLNSTEIEVMQNNGWCLSEIMHAQSTFPNSAARFYMLQMGKPSTDNHEACDDDSCKGLQIHLPSYQPRHFHETCQCSLLGPDPEMVNKCLREKSFPLLKIISTEDGVQVEVTPWEEKLGFVALSHVWADGLGNPSSLEIPSCQVARIGRLVSGITGRNFQSRDNGDSTVDWTEERELYVWIDSLCTPVNPEGSSPEADEMKKLGIAKLQQVYKSASYVLVLDRSLAAISFASTDIVEVGVRIHTSRWIRRLWTFQEAGLAKTLLICFADQVVDFREIWHQIEKLYRTDVQHRNIAGKLSAACANLRVWFSESNRLGKNQKIGNIIHDLSRRRASVLSDEPICIAGAFDLKTEAIAAAPESEQMQTLWKLMSQSDRGVTQRSIFNDQPRIGAEGFRWAPRTLQRRFAEPMEVFGGADNLDPGILTAHGLQIKSVGWKLNLFNPPLGTPSADASNSQAGKFKRIVYGRDGDGRWWYITQHRQLTFDDVKSESKANEMLADFLNDHTKDWFIILDNSVEKNGHRALLVWQSAHSSGVTIFRSAMLVWLTRVDPATEHVWSLCHPHAMKLRRSWMLKVIHCFTKLEHILTWAVQCFPAVVSKPISESLATVFKKIETSLWNRFEKGFLQIVTKIASSADGQAAMKAARLNPVEKTELTFFVLHPFMGKVAEVAEKYPETHEWCVD